MYLYELNFELAMGYEVIIADNFFLFLWLDFYDKYFVFSYLGKPNFCCRTGKENAKFPIKEARCDNFYWSYSNLWRGGKN